MEHTKLPWTEPRIYKDCDNRPYCISIYGGELTIAVHQHGVNSKNCDEAKANAEFIVKACNAHYEMLGVLKRMVLYFDKSDMLPELKFKIDGAKQAIAKAEGK